ncbi:type I DNA topoisomerase [Candidatus Dojkabacteria bacterium]|nr:type I DNA topoisomerase [Candidatus Dojkabacteria bacterium]
MDKLVIVESPSKAKTIKKYLGKGFEVKASKGHIVDLPKSELGVDIDKNFEANYVVTKSSSLKELKASFKGKTNLILAVDQDREGEAIGWHIGQKLGVVDKKGKVKKGFDLKRITFTSITKDEILKAIEHPRDIDMNLVNAQQARRILDRLVGYKLSPLLWKKLRYGLSAGRVQSVALRLIVDRETERDKFNSEEYWNIYAWLDKNKGVKTNCQIVTKDKEYVEDFKGIKFELVEPKDKLENQKSSEDILQKLQSGNWLIIGKENKSQNRKPKPPFTTSLLQRTALNKLNYSAKQTMMIAQKLYESGLITYMRTDATNFSPEAVENARKYIKSEFGNEYLPDKPNFYSKSAKVAQEAHEAIRPTDFNTTIKKLNLDAKEAKLYELIWARALASQMNEAVVSLERVRVKNGDYTFQANGQKVVFKGYTKVYSEGIQDQILPELSIGMELYANDIIGKQSFTQPPARYTEASMIKALESYGIGRPSTYVPIISTIQNRNYVEKEGKYFKPSDTGKVVIRLLTDHFSEIVDYDFTAALEAKLDDIANGKLDWVEMMGDFYTPFEKILKEKEKSIDKDAYTKLGDAPDEIKCPDCGAKMIIKLGRFGKFYSCSKWPECKGILGNESTSKEDLENFLKSENFNKYYKIAPISEDSKIYVLKQGRFGKFWAHPDYPKVKDARPLEYKDEVVEEIYGKTPVSKDGTLMLLKSGRFGEYWAHPQYPKVKEIQRINKKQIDERKKELGLE